ncbi:MAG: transglutaminase domain-containing protein [Candidatus Omnitrophica bacterium]|nr:transglutaminase domain-containing protein [Candidatus Omnitrophota bacterium]
MPRENLQKNTKKAYLLTVIIPLVLVVTLPPRSFAQGLTLERVTSFVHTPTQLAGWLSRDFEYIFQLGDGWQPAEETINKGTGDCEDFAVLAQEVLKRLGIRSDIVIVKLKGLNIAHAICLWQEEDGSYSFISNQEICRTQKKSPQEAVAKFYPDWERLVYMDKNQRYLKTALRSK